MKLPESKPDGLSPFDRFREFARRIAAVPKAEIDQEEEKYQRQQAQKKEQRLRAPTGGR